MTLPAPPLRGSPPLLDPRSRGWVLLAALSCLLPLLLQVPRPLAIGLGATAVVVAVLARRQALPGWLRVIAALALAAVVMVEMGFNLGRDTGCALLAAMLAIKPAETSGLRDARSLVGFGLFAPFATFLLDQGPLSLGLGLLAATSGLVALQRLADLESGDVHRALPTWRRITSAWRMVAIGLPLALAAFWLFPRLASPLWGAPELVQERPGLSDSMTPGEWVDMLTDDTPAARVRFFGPVPPQEQMYWRGLVMVHFDGRTWTQSPAVRHFPAPAVSLGPNRWDYELELEPTDREQLVALDLPAAAPTGATLGADYALRVTRPLDEVSRWRMQSAPPRVFEPRLERNMRRDALELPSGYNPRALALARQWRTEAGSDDAAIVQRALAWVRAEFAYTLAVPPLGRHAVDEFLFTHKAGYCEHFSSALVVLMRGAGIPARVIGGYAGGERNPIGDYWLLRRSDAHAWAEVWLPQRGWIRVDPTAAVSPERVFDTLADRAGASGSLLGTLMPALHVGDWLRRGWNDFVLGFDARRQAQMLKPLGIDEIPPQRLILLFALVAVLALLAAVWLGTREAREPDPVLRAWHRLGARYARFGLGREPHEPAGDWAQRVSRARPRDSKLILLSARFAEWRYARGDGDRSTSRALARDLRAYHPNRET